LAFADLAPFGLQVSPIIKGLDLVKPGLIAIILQAIANITP
jgi:hypothetical protein